MLQIFEGVEGGLRVKGIIHWELLPAGCTITADLYCQQLDRVAEKLQGKLDRIYFLHDKCSTSCRKVDA